MEVEIERLLEESPADPRRHFDQDRVRRYSEVLDQLPPVVVFELGDQTLLLADGYHRVAAAQLAGRTTVQADVRVGTKSRPYSSPSMSHVPSGACRLEARDAIRHYSGGQKQRCSEGQLISTAQRAIDLYGSRLGHPFRPRERPATVGLRHAIRAGAADLADGS